MVGNLHGNDEMKIKDLPKDQKPREKAICYGIENISDGELLALMISSGTKDRSALEIGNELITSYQNLQLLSKETYTNLSKQKGLSTAISLKLAACFEIARRINGAKQLYQRKIKDSSDIYNLYRFIALETDEKAYLLLLSKKGVVLKETKINGHYQDSVELTAKEIINNVLISNADMLVIIHNHPDGTLKPSGQDIFATEQIREILKSVGATLFDHIIITKDGYYSFNDYNLLSNYPKRNLKL